MVSGMSRWTYSVEVGTTCFAEPLRTIGERRRSSRAWREANQESLMVAFITSPCIMGGFVPNRIQFGWHDRARQAR